MSDYEISTEDIERYCEKNAKKLEDRYCGDCANLIVENIQEDVGVGMLTVAQNVYCKLNKDGTDCDIIYDHVVDGDYDDGIWEEKMESGNL